MKKLVSLVITLLVLTSANANRFVEVDSDGGSLPSWLIGYLLIGVVVLVHEKSPFREWANLNPMSAIGLFLLLPVLFLFKKLMAVVGLIFVVLVGYAMFRGSRVPSRMSTSDEANDKSIQKARREVTRSTSQKSGESSQIASFYPLNPVDPVSSGFSEEQIFHASRIAQINIEDREKLALEFHTVLKKSIDWSNVNHYRKTGGLDSDLGNIVLLICVLMFFQPLAIDQDSPESLQISDEQIKKWVQSVVPKIANICSSEIVSNIFVEFNFDEPDQFAFSDVDFAFEKDVRLAARHVLNCFSLPFITLQIIGRTADSTARK
jgi:uncharacterized membrane protein